MIRTTPALLLAMPLLWGCHTSEPSPWARTIPSDSPIHMAPAAVDRSGAVALAGGFQDTIDLGEGTLHGDPTDDDVFVGMFSAGGKSMWSNATGSTDAQRATDIAFAPDGDLIVAGVFHNEVSFGDTKLTALQQDAFLARLDRSGKTRWVKQWSGDDGGPSGSGMLFPPRVVAGPEGITLGGIFRGTIGFGGPPLDNGPDNDTGYVARVDHQGRHVFSVAFGGQNNAVGALTTDEAGDVYLTGTDTIEVEIGGTAFTAGGQPCALAARLGPDGTPRWAFQVGSRTSSLGIPGSSQGGVIALDANGDVLLSGWYDGPIQIDQFQLEGQSRSSFVLKVSGDGKPLWVHDFPNSFISGIRIDEAGRVVVGGSYSSPSDFGGGMLPETSLLNAFITTLDLKEGKLLGTLVLGEPDRESQISGLAVTGNDVVVTGNFRGALQLPGKALMAPADSPFGLDFVARLEP